MRAKFLHAFLVLAALFLFEAALLLVSCNQNSTFGCVETERQALLKFKACFVDPSRKLSSWTGNNCCEWKGVGCGKNSNHVVSLALRGESYYYGDDKSLVVNGSGGDVASILLELKLLEYLDLSINEFNGRSISSSFGLMEHLRYLNLSNAGFRGEIPHQLGNLTRLCILDLSHNGAYYGVQASDIGWMSQLRSLQLLDMQDVWLSSATSPNVFQVLNNLPSLTWLSLSECDLDNSHLSLGGHPFNSTFLGNIQHLDLSHNSIQVPKLGFIANMTSLEFLDLSSSSLIGPIPSWIGTMSTLRELDLSVNNFQGTIQFSGEVGNSFGHLLELEYLNIRSNQFSGSIPDNIRKLSKLETLDLSSNQLIGAIPASIGQLSKLETLDLSYNRLVGAIPASIVQLSKLVTLELSYNRLVGAIPASVVQLSKLETLSLYSNKLTGVIPASMGQLSKLKTLNLSNNRLTGAIPVSIGQLSNLQQLHVLGNYLQGVVSEAHFEKLANLKSLDIGLNRLNCTFKFDWRPPFHIQSISLNSCKLGTRFPKWLLLQKTTQRLDLSNASILGPLPENIGRMMSELESLFLANNHINGSIPESLRNLKCLLKLDMSDNMLSGNIPDCWRSDRLNHLNLGSNKFSGLIPHSIGQLSSLESLYLNNNKMHGELVALANCRDMMLLDVGENAFSGNITWIGERLHSLEVLRLRRNLFSGHIPLTLCMLYGLRILDLAQNKFGGKIPSCFQNCSCMITGQDCPSHYYDYGGHFMEVMKGKNMDYESEPARALATIDLSCNNLEGHIPEEITLLVALNGLNMSYNHLSGEIPKSIGQMKNLESLDLSQNVLSGTIPSSLSELTMISRLNLSYNNFSGPIPTGNQLQVLDDPSTIYSGNPLLCGPPLLTKCRWNAQPPTSTPSESKDNNEDAREKMLFYFIVMSGFATGFWGVIGVLIFKKTWRHALFRMVDNVQDRIHVAVALKMKQFKKMTLNRNPNDE